MYRGFALGMMIIRRDHVTCLFLLLRYSLISDMSANATGQRAETNDQLPWSGTTTSSTDSLSGQGSESLSDAFVAVPAGRNPRRGANQCVAAPQSSSHLNVRRSTRVVPSRARSTQPNSLSTSNQLFVEAPPGGRRAAGYAYQVLQNVPEEGPGDPSQSGQPIGTSGNAGDSRDNATPPGEFNGWHGTLGGSQAFSECSVLVGKNGPPAA